ncbi:MAG: transthyretin family protein [Ilumatobacteraceae bacterium]|nr:transthyretin family protein [Ilumatobacteraceae bacterium]MCU1390526.1 transthyretin family protein [Ilumatobacteraceae bacterium]
MSPAGAEPRLTAHVLDVGRGVPAAGMRLTLTRLDGTSRTSIIETVTNADGRTDAPLLGPETMQSGTYEVSYGVGDYFARTLPDGATTFFADVPVQFKVAESDTHVHVALLVSPWSYTTYRGS